MKLALKLLALAAATLIPLFYSACADSRDTTTQPALVAAANPPIADVPIPQDFSLAKSESTSKVYFQSGIREVDHVYHGHDNPLNVVRFYRENMPANGWAYTLQRESPDAITEFFSKNNEQCIIQISSGLLGTTIKVQIYPTGAAAGPAAAPK